MRDREPFISLTLYRLFKWGVVMPVTFTYLRGRLYGTENVPKRGPMLVVSNHASHFDPPILASCIGRPVAFMAKEELFQVPLLGPAIRHYGAYPVKRGTGDRGAIRAALSQLDNGWLVGMFMEGTRTPDGRIPNPKLGAALIAAKAQVPLIPACLWGTQDILPKGKVFPRPSPVTIRIGHPIDPPKSSKRDDVEAVTQQCVDAVHLLLDRGR